MTEHTDRRDAFAERVAATLARMPEASAVRHDGNRIEIFTEDCTYTLVVCIKRKTSPWLEPYQFHRGRQ